MDLTEWIAKWTELAEYEGGEVPDVDARIAAVVDLCAYPIDASWVRPALEDHLWTAAPYRRGDRLKPAATGPERAIERAILGPDEEIAADRECCGGTVVDGISAVPLTLSPKVEADLLLLVDHDDGLKLYLAEVKADANNAWYATIELLRQMKLLSASLQTDYFHRKNARVPAGPPVIGLVLAPADYFEHAGKKGAAVDPARRLAEAVSTTHQLDVRLATWDGRDIAELEP